MLSSSSARSNVNRISVSRCELSDTRTSTQSTSTTQRLLSNSNNRSTSTTTNTPNGNKYNQEPINSSQRLPYRFLPPTTTPSTTTTSTTSQRIPVNIYRQHWLKQSIHYTYKPTSSCGPHVLTRGWYKVSTDRVSSCSMCTIRWHSSGTRTSTKPPSSSAESHKIQQQLLHTSYGPSPSPSDRYGRICVR